MDGSFATGTKLARFCITFVSKVRLRTLLGFCESITMPNIFGFKMAGQKNRRKMKPLTAVNFSIPSPSVNFSMTWFRMFEKICLISSGHAATDWAMVSSILST
eukprot:Lithocolla_globosa_v1_NODE_3645_length_1617_cov_3.406530.p4 type:complete len:103 gc:universal NODE_3645_length_1617_cov_3.406530:521-829(+)